MRMNPDHARAASRGGLLFGAALILAGGSCGQNPVVDAAVTSVCARNAEIIDTFVADGGIVSASAKLGATLACDAYAAIPEKRTAVTGAPLTSIQQRCSASGPVEGQEAWNAIYKAVCNAQ